MRQPASEVGDAFDPVRHDALMAVPMDEPVEVVAGVARLTRDVGLAEELAQEAMAMVWRKSHLFDAAKAGAPLSKEPLASLKVQLADRVRGIEDLQHRVVRCIGDPDVRLREDPVRMMRAIALAALETVGIPDAPRRIDDSAPLS